MTARNVITAHTAPGVVVLVCDVATAVAVADSIELGVASGGVSTVGRPLGENDVELIRSAAAQAAADADPNTPVLFGGPPAPRALRFVGGDDQPEQPEDLREAFSMQYDADHKFPFVEDENCNITGYGHQDKAEFAAAVNHYDEICNGEPFREEEQWDEGYVGHYWVTIAPDGETLQRTTPEQDPDAIPVTGLWGQR